MNSLGHLNENHFELLLNIKEGADILGYKEAKLCREIQKINPNLIDICEAKGEYSVEDKLPYFGAIATQSGLDVARGRANG